MSGFLTIIGGVFVAVPLLIVVTTAWFWAIHRLIKPITNRIKDKELGEILGILIMIFTTGLALCAAGLLL